MILGLVGLLGFVLYSTYISPEPLIRRSLFNTPTAITAFAGTLLHGLIVWGLLYYMPLYFEVAKNYGPILSGVAIFPFTFTVAPSAAIVGIVITKTGRYRPSIVRHLPSTSGNESTDSYSGSAGLSRRLVWVS
jgi:hypothetical protein